MAKDTSDSLSSWIIFAIFLMAFTSVWDWIWDGKVRYALQYTTSTDNVTVDKKPQNCDFFYAPIGQKGCSYKKNVAVTKRAKDEKTGRKIISNDDGKTWDWDDADTEPQGVKVYVYWSKVEE